MNIQTKYNIGDKVFFVNFSGELGNININSSVVVRIEIIVSDSIGGIHIAYKIRSIRETKYYYINEKYLFASEAEIIKFFNNNIRSCKLNPRKEFIVDNEVTTTVGPWFNDDTLPF